MPRRMVAIVLPVLLCLGSGCHVQKVQQLPPTNVTQPEKETIVGVTTLKGEEVSFDPPGASIRDKTLYAFVKKTP